MHVRVTWSKIRGQSSIKVLRFQRQLGQITYPQLVLAMGKLAEFAVETCSFFLEVATDLGLEPGVGGSWRLTFDGRVELEAGTMGLSREEWSIGVDGVSHSELLRCVKLLPDHEIGHLLTHIEVPEGRIGLDVKVVVEVLPQRVHALESTWSSVKALGHDARRASLGAGSAEAGEEVFRFIEFEHDDGEEGRKVDFWHTSLILLGFSWILITLTQECQSEEVSSLSVEDLRD